MRVVAIVPPELDPFRRAGDLEGVELTTAIEPLAVRDALASADAILLAPRFGTMLRDLWSSVENVKWIHALGAGVETLPFDLLEPTGIVVTNSRGIYGDALAEFVIAAMLWFAKDLRRLVQNQQARTWEPFTVHRLEGQRLSIIGYGGIGRAIGRRAEALGLTVGSASRTTDSGEVDALVAAADYVVVSAPLTPMTRGLLSRQRIQSMRPEAVLINVARGALVDEEALVESLVSGRIRGAALDVFAVEPLPPSHPLWTLENVLLSPHAADHTFDSYDRAMDLFARNLIRFRNGEALENVVDKRQQY